MEDPEIVIAWLSASNSRYGAYLHILILLITFCLKMGKAVIWVPGNSKLQNPTKKLTYLVDLSGPCLYIFKDGSSVNFSFD